MTQKIKHYLNISLISVTISPGISFLAFRTRSLYTQPLPHVLAFRFFPIPSDSNGPAKRADLPTPARKGLTASDFLDISPSHPSSFGCGANSGEARLAGISILSARNVVKRRALHSTVPTSLLSDS